MRIIVPTSRRFYLIADAIAVLHDAEHAFDSNFAHDALILNVLRSIRLRRSLTVRTCYGWSTRYPEILRLRWVAKLSRLTTWLTRIAKRPLKLHFSHDHDDQTGTWLYHAIAVC